MTARLVALVMAVCGVFGITLGVTEQELVEAVTIIVTGLSTLYGAYRAWRSERLSARPPGEVVDDDRLRLLERRSALLDRWERSSGKAPPVERDPAPDRTSPGRSAP